MVFVVIPGVLLFALTVTELIFTIQAIPAHQVYYRQSIKPWALVKDKTGFVYGTGSIDEHAGAMAMIVNCNSYNYYYAGKWSPKSIKITESTQRSNLISDQSVVLTGLCTCRIIMRSENFLTSTQR